LRSGWRRLRAVGSGIEIDKLREIDNLLVAARDLDSRAASIQGARELSADRPEIDALADDYHRWYATALSVIPEEQHTEFENLYEGGAFIKRIRSFLASPGEMNPVFDPAAESTLISYWQHPFGSTFHTSFMEQRQALAHARQMIEAAQDAAEVELVERIGRGLPRLISALGRRGRERPPVSVADEYDIQYLLEGLLRDLFNDVRPEDPSPTRAAASTRIDFVLRDEQIVVEAKMTREGLGERQVADELIEDIERYRSHPACRTLVAIVFDPERRIHNPRGLESDLHRNEPDMRVRIVVCS
jgi:hypothetical protein